MLYLPYVMRCDHIQPMRQKYTTSRRVSARRGKRYVVALRSRGRTPDPYGLTRALNGSDLSVSREVAELISADFDLECNLQSNGSQSGTLDTEWLAIAGNSLSKLWYNSENVTARLVESLPLAARQRTLPAFAANQLTLQCGLFCQQLVDTRHLLRPGSNHLDLYVMSNLCVKVGCDLLHDVPSANVYVLSHSHSVAASLEPMC